MTQTPQTSARWGDSYRLIASEKWKAKSAAMGAHATEAIVDLANPLPGMKVLDLASGTGEPAISIAARIGNTGHVTAFDQSSDLLEIAAERARQRDLQNLSTRQGDAQELPFPDQSFDLVTSRFGVMFFQDCVRAMREVRRVLKPSARACFLVWGPFEQPYWSSMMGVVARHIDWPILPPGGPNPFRFSQPGSLPEVLHNAGFTAVDEQTRVLPWTWPGTAEEVWEQARSVSAPFLPALQRVPAGQWEQIEREIYQAINRYRVGDELRFTATVNLASATKN